MEDGNNDSLLNLQRIFNLSYLNYETLALNYSLIITNDYYDSINNILKNSF